MIREEVLRVVFIANMLDNRETPYTHESPAAEIIDEQWGELEDLLVELEDTGGWAREEIAALVGNLPAHGDLTDTAATIGSIIVTTGHFPLVDIWFSKAFSDELDILKASMFGHGSLTTEHGCRFSFTKEILTNENEISRVLSNNLSCLSRVDINNILSISQLCHANTIKYPENYEDILISNMKTTDYLRYDKGASERYGSYLRDDRLYKVLKYLEAGIS